MNSKDKIFEGILLVTDMDGTLLNTSKQVSPENLAALKGFVDRGGLFTIATGRINASVEPYLSCLPVNAPAILYNGGLIYDFDKHHVLWAKTLPEWIKDTIPMILEQFHGIGVEVYTEDGDVYVLSENKFTDQHQIHDKLVFHQDSDYRFKPWRKILCTWEPKKLERLEVWLKKENISLPFVRSEPQFLEILPEEVNKGTALEILIKYLKISPTNVVAMGDNLNDMEMLQRAEVGIAVANANDDLKKVALFNCTHHDNHAVREVIHWITQEWEKVLLSI